ncbi:MAG: hypothetical protein HFH72_08765 [Lachnospiraceae bacterium]|nr:hypothetical protein [Lachnospiraceae bacterium]
MNIIEIPLEHELFEKEICGELSNFIYNEFSLIFTLEKEMILGVTVFFQANDGDISGTQVHLVRHGKEWIKDICYEIKLEENSKHGFNVYCNSFDKKYTDIGYVIVEQVIKVMLYIMTTPREKVTKPKFPKEETERKEIRSKTRKENKVYLLDEIVEYINENGLTISQNGTHKINCPCWSVRGHYRHYKSGKVIFVENYKKGKERENKEPKSKTYTV